MIGLEDEVASQSRPILDRALEQSDLQKIGCLSVALQSLKVAHFPSASIPEDLKDSLTNGPPFSQLFAAIRNFTDENGIAVTRVWLRAQASRRLLDSYTASFEKSYPGERDKLNVSDCDDMLADEFEGPTMLLMHQETQLATHIITDDGSVKARQFIEELQKKGLQIEGRIHSTAS